ncbi:malonyl-ACP O-methyltransferase BioC [Serratia aquatilis]|uniref:Malonyl-[acyl-carrier protein] O-methyltransferase n=1 Tax=Serratia aquatilis TaxID=1737515 RepID=A0ABV6EKF7_9GAMM
MTSATEAVNKKAVASAFSRAAASYDSVAVLQREVGEHLLGMGMHHPGKTVLDAGCGTGYFSRRWRELGKQVTALDLAAGMLAFACQQQAANHYLLADIENIPLPSASVDISFSSLALQWCSDLPRALAELHRVTLPGGLILFSTLAEGTLHELGDAWQQVDGERHVNAFLPLTQIANACHSYRHHMESAWQTLTYPDVMTLMRSLKGIGATHLHQGREAGLLSRQRLAALQAAYVCQHGQYPLSYHLVYGVIYRD